MRFCGFNGLQTRFLASIWEKIKKENHEERLIWMRGRDWYMQRPCGGGKCGSFKGWKEGSSGFENRVRGNRVCVEARG